MAFTQAAPMLARVRRLLTSSVLDAQEAQITGLTIAWLLPEVICQIRSILDATRK